MTDNRSNEVKAILRALSDSLVIFEGFLRSIPTEVLDEKRGQDFWSLHEHAAHLADVQPMILDRIGRILSEDLPKFIPFIPENDNPVEITTLPSVDEIVARFTSWRGNQLELLENAGHDDWNRLAIHPEYDQYGLLVLARHVLMHDHWHMYRMEELWLTKDEYLTRLEG